MSRVVRVWSEVGVALSSVAKRSSYFTTVVCPVLVDRTESFQTLVVLPNTQRVLSHFELSTLKHTRTVAEVTRPFSTALNVLRTGSGKQDSTTSSLVGELVCEHKSQPVVLKTLSYQQGCTGRKETSCAHRKRGRGASALTLQLKRKV